MLCFRHLNEITNFSQQKGAAAAVFFAAYTALAHKVTLFVIGVLPHPTSLAVQTVSFGESSRAATRRASVWPLIATFAKAGRIRWILQTTPTATNLSSGHPSERHNPPRQRGYRCDARGRSRTHRSTPRTSPSRRGAVRCLIRRWMSRSESTRTTVSHTAVAEPPTPIVEEAGLPTSGQHSLPHRRHNEREPTGQDRTIRCCRKFRLHQCKLKVRARTPRDAAAPPRPSKMPGHKSQSYLAYR